MLFFVAVVKEMKTNCRRLQRSAARIVLKMAHLSTQDMASDLVWDPLKRRREERNISSNSSRIVLMTKLQVISQIIFDGELTIFMTMTLGLKIGYLLIESISS